MPVEGNNNSINNGDDERAEGIILATHRSSAITLYILDC